LPLRRVMELSSLMALTVAVPFVSSGPLLPAFQPGAAPWVCA
jgi:hypothetical protein